VNNPITFLLVREEEEEEEEEEACCTVGTARRNEIRCYERGKRPKLESREVETNAKSAASISRAPMGSSAMTSPSVTTWSHCPTRASAPQHDRRFRLTAFDRS